MQVHRTLESLPSFLRAVVTIGTFDGVHRGHRQIIRQLNDEARACEGESVIITFDPHPRRVLHPGTGALHLLTTLEEKISLIAGLGVDHLVVVPFTRAFSEITASGYVTDFLVERFHPHVIILGYDHHFGHNREGNIHLLRAMAPGYGFRVVEIPEQVSRNLTISSTKIREYLNAGDVKLAAELLGYPYFVSGRVIHGAARGRSLGFPTANLSFDHTEKLIPAEGVYAAIAEISGANGAQAERVAAAVNIGRLPTFDGRELRIEAYLLDFDRDIYDRELRIHFTDYLRGDIKFDSVEALIRRMEGDVQEVRLLLGNKG